MEREEADRLFMARALALARLGAGRTSPNPMVGAVVVKDGRVVGEGYHQKAGTPHAEVHALRAAGAAAAGATLYVSLEPCNHHGRTPPCTEAIIAAGIRRVVAATRDPNPQVNGSGMARLRAAGIEVVEGVMEEEARELNEAFFHFITTGHPFVVMKYAMSLDGRIATATGESRWISSEPARDYVHRLRAAVDAIMVGVGTVLRDDPQLTARPAGGANRHPVRVIVDSRLRTPPSARALTGRSEAPTWLATTPLAPPERRTAILDAARRNGCPVEILELPERGGRVDIAALTTELGRRGITSVLLEGGAELNAAALEAGAVRKILCFVAPKLVGGRTAPGPVGGAGIASLAEAWRVERLRAEAVGEDVLLTAYVAARRREPAPAPAGGARREASREG